MSELSGRDAAFELGTLMKILLFIALLAGITGTASARDPETVNVRVGQLKSADGGRLTVKFISVIEDSRCPIDAKCVWEGNARIKIEVSKGKASAKTIELNSGAKPESVTVYGYEIKFIDLSPHPGEMVKMVALPKMATLSVTRVR